MKRFSFFKLKTFLNTKFWLFNTINNGATFSDLTKNLSSSSLSASDGVVKDFANSIKNTGLNKVFNKRLKLLNFNRFVRLLSATKKSSNSNLLVRLIGLVRFFKTNLTMRRY